MHRTRRALLATLLVAVAVSLGLLLVAVPNVELLSFAVFLSGFMLGSRCGAVVGALSAAVFSVANPLGAAMPPLVAAQAIGMSVVGAVGGAAGPALVRLEKRLLAGAIAGGVGFALTLLYDALTNVGAYTTIAGEKSTAALVKFVLGGVLFLGLHVAWNTVLFSTALVPALRALAKFRDELSEG